MSLQIKKSILIIQPVLAHYRTSLFQMLVDSDKLDVNVVGGSDNSNVKGIEAGINGKIKSCLINKKIKVRGHIFIWQRGLFRLIKEKKPEIVVLTGVDPHLTSNLVLALLKIFYHVKIIWWGHATIYKHGKWGQKFRKFFFGLGDGIMTYNCESSSDLRLIIGKKIPIIAIKNCINLDEYGFNQKVIPGQKHDPTPFTILFSGRLTREKRVDILIKAIEIINKKNVEISCVIIGEGGEYQNAVNLSKDLGLANLIKFVGAKYQTDSIPYFTQADIFVLPGKVGLSIIHGLSYGLPIITSDKEEIHSPEFEIINKDKNGDLFSGFDEQDLADKILFWKSRIELNREAIKEICINSIKEDGYTPESMSSKMLNFFSEV